MKRASAGPTSMAAPFPASTLNPVDFGIRDGVTRAIGLPQMIVAGALNFGGPGTLPQGRFDTSYVVNDTVSRTSGRHSIRFGGEYRQFINENFAEGTGVFNFPSVAAFLTGTANAFNTTLGERASLIDQRAVGVFVQDQVTVHDRLTLELGMRYEWHVTPTERDNRFIVFDAARASLVRVGVDVDEIYAQNNLNLEPRAGVALAGLVRRPYRAARRVCAGGRRARNDRGQGHGGQSALRDSIDGPRDRFRSRPRSTRATRRARAVHHRSELPQRVGAIVERESAAAIRARHGGDGRLSRLARPRSAHLAQPQSAGRRRSSVRRRLGSQRDSSPESRLPTLRRWRAAAFSNYDGAWVSVTKRLSRGAAVRHVVHVVEVARHQFAQLVRLRDSGQL
jgi:hypothetical protein